MRGLVPLTFKPSARDAETETSDSPSSRLAPSYLANSRFVPHPANFQAFRSELWPCGSSSACIQRTKQQCGRRCPGHGIGRSTGGGKGVAVLGASGEPVNSVHVRCGVAGSERRRRGRGCGYRAVGAGVPPAPLSWMLTHTPPAWPQTAGRVLFFFWLNFGHVNCPPFTFAPITRRGRIPRGATARRRRAAS